MDLRLTIGTALLFSLAACGSGESGAPPETSETTEAAQPADSAMSTAPTETAAATMAPAATAQSVAPTATSAAPAAAKLSVARFNATCPGGIEVHADDGGPVYINGSEASVKKFNDNYFEAKGGGVTISVTDGSTSPSVSYTGPGRANGICTVG